MILKTIFWILIGLILYTYFGYTLLLLIVKVIKKQSGRDTESLAPENLPELTLFITAFNEKDIVDQKMQNSLSLNYPKNKLKILWITDGSDDGTYEQVKKYPEADVHHTKERKGKTHALNRGMQFVQTPIVVFSDSNTLLGENALLEIVKLFYHNNTGAVSGEKRIKMTGKDKAVSTGEGIYWRYESVIKKLESDVYSTLGAAGELFAIRTELYMPVKDDAILDDFVISLNIAMQGYQIKYAPEAYAIESASLNITEEIKRKIRIASGAIQTLARTKKLLNPFKYGFLSLQYLSHKVLRWVLLPVSFLLIFILNALIVFFEHNTGAAFLFLFFAQIVLYFMVFIGWLFSNRKMRLKVFFLPYYLFIMNYSILAGTIRYLSGKQTVIWEKARRK
ncbi:MAG: glycosyltransferase family 2 protein [Bacteroidales bacterium]|nr:glycosyltransferase family 2 protein [Bacteroidales bacterium]